MNITNYVVTIFKYEVVTDQFKRIISQTHFFFDLVFITTTLHVSAFFSHHQVCSYIT